MKKKLMILGSFISREELKNDQLKNLSGGSKSCKHGCTFWCCYKNVCYCRTDNASITCPFTTAYCLADPTTSITCPSDCNY
ncbi:MAG: hypothetical protein QM528_06575 [Phycisphaerales bacterium]|nr:hypothetical protein [Phycisphaerales bacterium]